MKSKLILTFIITLISLGVFSQQQIDNSDFESWKNVGSANELPENWNSIMNGNLCTLCAAGQEQTSWRDTETRPGSTGTYSVKIKTLKKTILFTTVYINGAITLGKLYAPSTTPSDGYNQTRMGEDPFYQTLTDKPDSIVFWAKYNVTDNSDYARISAVIHDAYNLKDPQTSSDLPHVVATANTDFQTNGGWVRMSLPFNYVGPSTDAQYIIVTLTSSNIPGGGKENSTLWVDDLELIYNPVPNIVTIAPTDPQYLIENQNGDELTVSESPNPADSRQWKYSTVSGGPYTNSIAGETNINYTPNFPTAGTYYVVCESNFGGDIQTSNEVAINVSEFLVSITPPAIQNLVENELGNELTVYENYTVDSREWKYSTTSGSGYTSFSPSQTGESYIPQFATAGTYYVVCESTYDGITVTSNEVEINVIEFTVAITPTAVQNIVENQLGSTLTVNESVTADSREWKYSTTSGSGYGSFTPIEPSTSYTPQFATAGTYYIVCESTYDGTTVTSNEVEINVSPLVDNVVSISPNAPQYLVENQAGASIHANELPVMADNRQWKYGTTSGGPYTNDLVGETGVSYIPQFATAGTYFVVVESDFEGDIKLSNEVEIIVSEFTVLIDPVETQNLFENEEGVELNATESPSADYREWKYSTTSGSGYVSFPSNESGLTYIPQFETAGTYYVVCESTISTVSVTSNEVIIIVEEPLEYYVNVTPNASQVLLVGEMGDELEAEEGPVAANSRQWKYGTTAGGPYIDILNGETGLTYTPQFSNTGTYYVVCESDFGYDVVTSNEVEITVSEFTFTVDVAPLSTQYLIEHQSGTPIVVTESEEVDSREWKYSTYSGSGYVPFSLAETGTTYIPQFSAAGTYYVVCESTIGDLTVTSGEVKIEVEEFIVTISPEEDQAIHLDEYGDELTVTESPLANSREWKYSTVSGADYVSFSPAETGETYSPHFDAPGTYYVICTSEIDGIYSTSNEVKVEVDHFTGISVNEFQSFKIYTIEQEMIVDFSEIDMSNSILEVYSMEGRRVIREKLTGSQINKIPLNVQTGIYSYKINIGDKFFTGKIFMK